MDVVKDQLQMETTVFDDISQTLTAQRDFARETTIMGTGRFYSVTFALNLGMFMDY